MKKILNKDVLFASALKYLSYRPRSRAEMETFLKKKSSDPDLINQIITDLLAQKLIDDSQFASWLVASRSRSRPRGARLLVQELKSKGIASEIIDSETSSVDEKSLASDALHKKISLWSHLSFQDFRIKATRYLAARGFSWSAIEEVVKKMYNDTHVS